MLPAFGVDAGDVTTMRVTGDDDEDEDGHNHHRGAQKWNTQ